MRILQVIPYFIPAYAFGGPVRVAYEISKELVNRGHEVVVFTSDVRNLNLRLDTDFREVIDGITVYYFRNLTMLLVKKLKLLLTPQLILYAKEEIKKFDVIHLHEYRTFQNIIIRHYATKYGVPYVLQAHGSLPRIGSWRKLKLVYDVLFGYRLLKDAAKVVALNKMEVKQYRSMGTPEEKIVVIPNGIDLSEYAKLPPKGAFRKKFNIPEDRKIILYLGRIHKIKGVDFLIKAYARVINETNCKDAILIIAGPDDGYLKEVQELTNRLGISKHVLITGPLYGQDKLQAYVDSEFYVLPSRYETFPMTVLEAYACGVPVIVSNVGGLKDLVINGKTGLLVNVDDVDQLTSAIHFLLNNGEETRRMGLRGKQLVKSNFSIEKMIEKIEELYEKVIKQRRS